MSQSMPKSMTFEEFVLWTQQQQQEGKFEFVDGLIYAMIGGTRAHSIIASNLIREAGIQLRNSPCHQVLTGDMLVHTGMDTGRYPNMTIDCGEYKSTDLVASNPVVVFEILSSGTRNTDRFIKLGEYNATPSIQHYVMLEQSEPTVYLYIRGSDSDFNMLPQVVSGLDSMLELPAVGIALLMREIYFNVIST